MVYAGTVSALFWAGSVRHDRAHPPIAIGVQYGPVVAGERRLEYAVIGDTVSVASRIEALTRERAVAALISGATLAAAGATLPGPARARQRPADGATLRGRDRPVELWTAA